MKANSYTAAGDNKDSFTLDRCKTSNGIGPRSVIFAPDVEKSPSSYSISEQLRLNSNYSNAITSSSVAASTSQLIKQTLSPLTQHRTIQSTTTANSIDSNSTVSPLKMKPSNHSSPVSNYQIKSNSYLMSNNGGGNGASSNINTNNNHNSNGNGSKTNISSLTNDTNASIYKSSSPSRSLSNHTNTLPSSIVRSNNILYQSESGYSLKTQPKTNFASPGNNGFSNAFNSLTSANSALLSSSSSTALAAATQTQSGTASTTSVSITNSSFPSNSIYGTLPKTSSPFNGPSVTSGIYGNVSAVANEFEQLIARNANNSSNSNSSNGAVSSSIGAGNYNTLGSYRVQYSSTNPFLPSFNPQSTADSLNTDYRLEEEK